MFSFLRKKAKPSEISSEEQNLTEQQSAAHDAEIAADTQASDEQGSVGFFGRLKQGLSRSSAKLTEALPIWCWAEKPLMMIYLKSWKPNY